MTQAISILERAARVLEDPEYVRWTKAEMLVWLSEAQVAIARIPGTYTKTACIDLVKGVRQTLPSDAWGLITVSHNVDEDDYPLDAVRLVTRSLLDCYEPRWHSGPRRQMVENYIYDERDPKTFFVYPPNDGYGRVELTYMALPPEIEDETDETAFDKSYDPALVSYILWRAHSKDADYAPGAQNAAQYFQAFQSDLTQAVTSRSLATPNATLTPGAVNQNGGTE